MGKKGMIPSLEPKNAVWQLLYLCAFMHHSRHAHTQPLTTTLASIVAVGRAMRLQLLTKAMIDSRSYLANG